MTTAHYAGTVSVLLVALAGAPPAFSQGRGPQGKMMGDPAHAADMLVFHQLFDHRSEIKRQVTLLDNGIETVTESANPEVTKLLKGHVLSMLARVKDARPIHRRDPLFAELFKYTAQIEARHEMTSGGVRVIETSKDPYVVKLLQAHAAVVTAFIENGMSEMMKNHPLPVREP